MLTTPDKASEESLLAGRRQGRSLARLPSAAQLLPATSPVPPVPPALDPTGPPRSLADQPAPRTPSTLPSPSFRIWYLPISLLFLLESLSDSGSSGCNFNFSYLCTDFLAALSQQSESRLRSCAMSEPGLRSSAGAQPNFGVGCLQQGLQRETVTLRHPEKLQAHRKASEK